MIRFAVAVAGLALLSSCSGIEVAWDWDDKAPWESLETFAWAHPQQPPVGDPLVDSSLLDTRIRDAVQRELRRRGFEPSPEPDFLVAYHAFHMHRVAVSAAAVDGRPLTEGRWDEDVDLTDYEEGMLLLDVINPEDETLWWRGYARSRIDPLASRDEKVRHVNGAVQQMLDGFPPLK